MTNSKDLDNEPTDGLTDAEKIAIMKVFFDEYNMLRQTGENAPYASFMAERARLIKYNEVKTQKQVCN
jgi:hypothetical protein